MSELRTLWESCGQGHVFRWWDLLNATEKETLTNDLHSIEVERIASIRDQAIATEEETKKAGGSKLAPIPVTKLADASGEQKAKWYDSGIQLIAAGKAAALVLAGGQGSRLGSNDPKGQYDIGLPSHKSLFQIQAERIGSLQRLVEKKTGRAAVVPWYIMTSVATDAPTRAFFRQHNYWGLKEEDVRFFVQGFLPCLTPEGKVIMESKCNIAKNPDGNGGIYLALVKSGALADMERRGVEHVHQYCVDNILIKVADPTFVGWAAAERADCAAKVCTKVAPNEPVGVLCLRDGKYAVVEYSEIDPKTAAQTNPDGSLTYNAAHLCINYYSVPFLAACAKEYCRQMKYHIARKKIPCIDVETGAAVKPAANNGWKMEQFIFDVFCYAGKMSALEVARSDDFSPLKNAPGTPEDSPDSSRAHLSALHSRYLIAAGAKLEGTGICEISPTLSYDGEGLEALVAGKTFRFELQLL